MEAGMCPVPVSVVPAPHLTPPPQEIGCGRNLMMVVLIKVTDRISEKGKREASNNEALVPGEKEGRIPNDLSTKGYIFEVIWSP